MSQLIEKQVDLKKFQRYKRKFPWSLIGKIVIVFVVLGLLFYLNKMLANNKAKGSREIEVDIETNNAPEASPDQ